MLARCGSTGRCILAFVLAFASLVAAAADADSVTGTMTVGRNTYKLTHVWARKQASMSEVSKTVVLVLLTDNPVPQSVIDDKYRLELANIARDGKLHGIAVSVGADKKPTGAGFTYAQELGGAIVNRDDQHTFAPSVLNDTRIEGKLSGGGSVGNDKWSYTADIKAAVSTLK